MSPKMIFFVLLILLGASLTESEEQTGDACNLTDGSPGVCSFLEDCKEVFDELTEGLKTPDKVCRFSGYEPIICCPASTAATETPSTTVKGSSDAQRSSIAREKCAEYSKYVHTLQNHSSLGSYRVVNVSQCGMRPDLLFIGVESPARMEYPHMAAVGFIKEDGSIGWLCSGSIISENFVLTAAHCTYSSDFGEAAWVRFGDLNLDAANPTDIRITERIRHPEYKPPAHRQYHDIALLRLETAIKFNDFARPACLHLEPTPGTQKAVATGWGRINWNGEEASNDLTAVRLRLIDSATCNASWTAAGDGFRMPKGVIKEWSICAGGGDQDSCQGDLTIPSQKIYCMYEIIGVTSLGKICYRDRPGIYTRVY